MGAPTRAQLIRLPNITLNLSETASPATLSATGAFSDLATLAPHPGIVPYTPNVAFWSDYAQKKRWFSIPNLADKMTFRQDENWHFPAGTVWVKHFDLPNVRENPDGPSRRIETRFLVKKADGVFGLSYRWREDQSDADLVSEGGASAYYTVMSNGQLVEQLWQYPSRNNCISCHSAASGYGLSVNTRQLNGPHLHGGQTLNQIKAWSDAGYFTAPISNVNNMPVYAGATDLTQSLESRVRSYFAVNCSDCHQPGGMVSPGWDARVTTPTDAAGIIDGQVHGWDFGFPKVKIIAPGDLSNSLLYQRVTGGAARMPPLATTELDRAAAQLLSDWIQNELPSRRSFVQWQTHHFGSAQHSEADPEADPDGDGRKNLEEYLSNRNPIDATSFLPHMRLYSGGDTLQLWYTQPANRSAVIETSTSLTKDWTLLDVPGNAPDFAAAETTRALSMPAGEGRRFFRMRLSEP